MWTEPVTVTLPGSYAERLRAAAGVGGRSVSALVAEAVAAWLDGQRAECRRPDGREAIGEVEHSD
jgi:hypothetical protein